MTDSVCKDTWRDRTQAVTLKNNTAWGVKIWLIRLEDQSGKILKGFAGDTGVFVGATDQPGKTDLSIDPCYEGEEPKPIQATRASCIVKLEYGNQQIDLAAEDHIADNISEYLTNLGWELNLVTNLSDTSSRPEIKRVQQMAKRR
jgi:hypothetical protein